MFLLMCACVCVWCCWQVFDNKLNRRRYGEYAEDYSGPTMGGDSAGIHASGEGEGE